METGKLIPRLIISTECTLILRFGTGLGRPDGFKSGSTQIRPEPDSQFQVRPEVNLRPEMQNQVNPKVPVQVQFQVELVDLKAFSTYFNEQ